MNGILTFGSVDASETGVLNDLLKVSRSFASSVEVERLISSFDDEWLLDDVREQSFILIFCEFKTASYWQQFQKNGCAFYSLTVGVSPGRAT